MKYAVYKLVKNRNTKMYSALQVYEIKSYDTSYPEKSYINRFGEKFIIENFDFDTHLEAVIYEQYLKTGKF